MPGFSLTPLGTFPPAAPADFPVGVQWQQDGTNLGDRTIDTIDLSDGLTGTRGTGETANVLTLQAISVPSTGLAWQVDGVEVGDGTTIDTINLTDGVTATLAGSVLTVVADPPAFSWRDVPADTTLAASDAGNGLSMSGNTGGQVVTVPGDDIAIDPGEMVLIYAEGGATVSIIAASGVLLNVRSGLELELAGQYATVTLIKRRANEWIACGDLVVTG